jgi:hypothetical protein
LRSGKALLKGQAFGASVGGDAGDEFCARPAARSLRRAFRDAHFQADLIFEGEFPGRDKAPVPCRVDPCIHAFRCVPLALA